MTNASILIAVAGKLKGQRFVVTPEGLRLGRQEGNELHLDDQGVSRQHARVLFHNGALWVQDLGSRNGVFVNETRVQAHRQLSVGDQLKVGGNVFEVALEQVPPDKSVSVVRKRPGGKRGGWKIWPFVLVGVGLAVLLVLVVVAGRGRVKIADPVEDDDGVTSLLLSATEELEGEGTQPAGGTQAQPAGGTQAQPADRAVAPDASLTSLLEDDAQGSVQPPLATAAVVEEEWPEPPPGVSSAELVDKAHGLYRAGRLHEALVAYHQARMLDKACEICARRIDRLNTEIATAISEHFDAGIRYYNNLQYEQAIASWEMVLLLAPNPAAKAHKEAKLYLEKAQGKMKSQY